MKRKDGSRFDVIQGISDVIADTKMDRLGDVTMALGDQLHGDTSQLRCDGRDVQMEHFTDLSSSIKTAQTGIGVAQQIRRLRDEVEQAENELALFFTESLDLLCIASLDGYFKRLNPAWTTALGWTLDELQARPFLDQVHPDDRASTLAVIATLAKGATTISFENRYRRKDGAYRWLQWNARPMPCNQRIYASARDVTRQKRLEREIIEIADQEKQRLGRELHDGLCQTLAGITALSATLSRSLAAGAQSVAAAEITGLLSEAITEAQGLARGLAPGGLKEDGLHGALTALAGNIRRLFHVSCTFKGDRPFHRLRSEVEAHLFRIAQEAVSNAVTHGRAQRIDISLKCADGHGLLSVRDDGVGIPRDMTAQDGIGLHTMTYRSRLIGATLELRRRARHGTVVTCAFPLPETAESRDNAFDSA